MARRPPVARGGALRGGIGAVVGVAGVVTIALVVAELWVHPHVDAAGLRSAIETLITLLALASALLLRIRFRQTRLLRDLMLTVSLATVSVTNLVFNGLAALSNSYTISYGHDARATLIAVLGASFLAAALVPARHRVPAGSLVPMLVAPVGIGMVTVAEIIDRIAGSTTPSSYRSALPAVALAASVMMLIAGIRFAATRLPGKLEAELLAGASFLLAAAWLQRVVWPSVPANWVAPADVARVAAYGLLLAVALRLHERTRTQQSREAVTTERLRIARDLHDGLAQDLAFIAAHSDRLAAELGTDHPVAIAARRALAASRGTIVDLEASRAPSTEAALREVAAELAARFGIEVVVRAEDPGDLNTVSDLDTSMWERRELVRIAREAIVNAVRHGNARHVLVTLGSGRGKLLIRVVDDGWGLGTPAARRNAGTGLGMRTMRARAETLNGRLVARRGELGGTEICVVARPHEAQHYQ